MSKESGGSMTFDCKSPNWQGKAILPKLSDFCGKNCCGWREPLSGGIGSRTALLGREAHLLSDSNRCLAYAVGLPNSNIRLTYPGSISADAHIRLPDSDGRLSNSVGLTDSNVWLTDSNRSAPNTHIRLANSTGVESNSIGLANSDRCFTNPNIQFTARND